MADKNGDHEDSGSGDEVETTDQQSGKTEAKAKKKWKDRLEDRTPNFLKRKKNKPPNDQNPKKEDGPKGKESRKLSSDGSTSDTLIPREMPQLEEEKGYLHRTQPLLKPPMYPVPGFPYRHGSNSATILSQPHIPSAKPVSTHSTFDQLPLISTTQVRSFS